MRFSPFHFCLKVVEEYFSSGGIVLDSGAEVTSNYRRYLVACIFDTDSKEFPLILQIMVKILGTTPLILTHFTCFNVDYI